MPYSKRKYTPDEIRIFRREVNKRYSASHPEAEREKYKRYRQRHPERAMAAVESYRKRNPLMVATWSLRSRLNFRQAYVDGYGGCCACCGETELLFLTLDHVYGNGAEHRRSYEDPERIKRFNRPSGAGQKKIISELKELGWPKEDGHFRILCWNCQWGVRYPGGCPHQWPEPSPEDQ